jgi:hypothetical protein
MTRRACQRASGQTSGRFGEIYAGQLFRQRFFNQYAAGRRRVYQIPPPCGRTCCPSWGLSHARGAPGPGAGRRTRRANRPAWIARPGAKIKRRLRPAIRMSGLVRRADRTARRRADRRARWRADRRTWRRAIFRRRLRPILAAIRRIQRHTRGGIRAAARRGHDDVIVTAKQKRNGVKISAQTNNAANLRRVAAQPLHRAADGVRICMEGHLCLCPGAPAHSVKISAPQRKRSRPSGVTS